MWSHCHLIWFQINYYCGLGWFLFEGRYTYIANLEKTRAGRVIITASEANELSRQGSE